MAINYSAWLELRRSSLSIKLQSREQRKLASFAEIKQRLKETPHKPDRAQCGVWGKRPSLRFFYPQTAKIRDFLVRGYWERLPPARQHQISWVVMMVIIC